jgi:hypothetical protein
MTTATIDEILGRRRVGGEAGGGRWYSCADLVMVSAQFGVKLESRTAAK